MEDKVWYEYPEPETKFAFRVSMSMNDIGLGLAPILELCQRFIIYEHEADKDVSRTHIHGLMRVCSKRHDTVRNQFKKLFPKNYQLSETYKNSANEVKPVDDGYITYMAKGGLEPKAYESYTPEEIKYWSDLWEHHAPKPTITLQSGKIVITKEVEKARKAKKHETIMKVVAEIDKMKQALPEANVEHFFPYPDVLRILIKELKEQQQCLGMYKVCEYVDAIMMYQNPKMFIYKATDYFENRDSKFAQRFN